VFFADVMRNATTDALAGLWLFASAFVFAAGYQFFVSNLAAGGLVAILGFFGPFANPAFAWIPAIVGLWVMVSPVALGFTEHGAATLSNVITGLAILVLSIRSWSMTKGARGSGIPDHGQ
jgi:hypothetical protein